MLQAYAQIEGVWGLRRDTGPGGYIRRREANVLDGSASGSVKLRNLSSELGPTWASSVRRLKDDDASRDWTLITHRLFTSHRTPARPRRM